MSARARRQMPGPRPAPRTGPCSDALFGAMCAGARLPALAAAAREFLDLPGSRIEGLAQRHVGVLVVLVIDHDLLAGHADLEPHHEVPPLAVVVVRRLHHDAAAQDAAVEALELAHPAPDARLE